MHLNRRVMVFGVLLLTSLLLTGCLGMLRIAPKKEFGSLAVTVIVPDGEVAQIRVAATSGGHTLTETVAVQSDDESVTVAFNTIEVGVWNVVAEALGKDQALLFSESDQALVTKDATTEMEIELAAAVSDIEVTISLGGLGQSAIASIDSAEVVLNPGNHVVPLVFDNGLATAEFSNVRAGTTTLTARLLDEWGLPVATGAELLDVEPFESYSVAITLEDHLADWELALRMDFEDDTVGEHAEGIKLSGNSETSGASVRVTNEEAARGVQSLKVSETTTGADNYIPSFTVEPDSPIRGKIRVSFSFMRGDNAGFEVRFRTGGSIGPDVSVTRDGKLVDNDVELPITIPANEWVHILIDYVVGSANPDKEYTLKVRMDDGTVETFTGEAVTQIAAVGNVQWQSFGDRGTIYYIDDIVVLAQ